MKTPAIALAALLALPLVASGQEAAPQLEEDPRAPKFHEVERGFFIGFEAGYLSILKTPTADTVRYKYAGPSGGHAGGFAVGVSAGFDFGSRVALSVFALGSDQQASPSYGGFDVLAAGGDLRVAVLALNDANGVDRFHVYLHGRAGYLRTYPDGLFGHSDVLLAGGPGIEYFTRLRHFSLGIGSDVVYVVKANAPGFSVVPSIRYAF